MNREERPKREEWEKETQKKKDKRTGYDNPETDYDESQLEMGDKYDVIKQTITVNSPISTMNPDFIMADLHPNLMNNQVMKYVRNNLEIIEVINIYLCEEEDKIWKTRINQLILNGVYSLTNLSRADKAKVINAILEYIKSGGGDANIPMTTAEEEPTRKPGILDKINIFKKKEQE